MKDVKTVDSPLSIQDLIIAKQKEDVARMRASLLCCSDDPYTATQAMKNITVLRVYHQVSRIIKYLEMMDKIEDKLYESIDIQLDNMDSASPVTWMTLLNIQEKLQKNMIESHKLLQPYLEQMKDIEEFVVVSERVIEDQEDDVNKLISKESRERLRSSAQQVLSILGPAEEGVKVDR